MVWKKRQDKIIEEVKKVRTYYLLLNKWIRLKNIGKTTGTFCKNHNYKSVAVYGMSEMGCNLCDELMIAGIEVKYGIDRNVEETYLPIEVVNLDTIANMPKVDAIIVTATYYYEEIERILKETTHAQIHSFEEVLEDIL